MSEAKRKDKNRHIKSEIKAGNLSDADSSRSES